MENYRLSKYNFFRKRKDKIIGINLFNKNLFAIDAKYYDILINNKDCLTKLKENEPVLFSTMYKLGVIEDTATDIPAILIMKNRKQVFSDSHHRVMVMPTLNCNFSCWYCYETHPRKMMEDDIVNNIIKYIKNLVEERRITSLHLDWFGGEPLMGFERVMKPITIEAKKLCDENKVFFWMTITTNGFFIKDSMIPFFKEYNMKSFQITLDGNEEQHNKVRYYGKDKKGSYSTIVRNICLLAQDINVLLRINYTKDILDNITDIIAFFPQEIRKNIKIALMQVWQDRSLNTTNDRDILIEKEQKINRIFERAGFYIHSYTFGSDICYACYADVMGTAVINYDGRVFKCTTSDFEHAPEDGILTEKGHIVWNDDRIARRVSKATFDNKYCLKCKYLPICAGGCSTHKQRVNARCNFKPHYKAKVIEFINKFDEKDYKTAHLSQI